MLFEIKLKKKIFKVRKDVLIEILSKLGCNKDLGNSRIYFELKKRGLLNDEFLKIVQGL